MHSAEPTTVPPSRTWLAVAPAMVVPLLGSFVYFVWFSDTPLGKAAYVFTKSFTLLWPLVGVFLILKLRVADLRQYKPFSTHLKTAPLGVALGLLIVGGMLVLMQTPLGSEVLAGAANVRQKARALGFLDHFIPFAIFISFVHSAIEEYYWRWFLYGNLRRVVPLAAAHVLAALAFSAHHIVVLSQFFALPLAIFLGLAVGVGGLIWSYLYQRQGSLLAPWICHAIADLGIMAIGYKLLFT